MVSAEESCRILLLRVRAMRTILNGTLGTPVEEVINLVSHHLPCLARRHTKSADQMMQVVVDQSVLDDTPSFFLIIGYHEAPG
ncbi:hypothetical protein AC579_4368 [Pseudocercospora musae]|uniref:Uncharacterized protein n=1 Tax=Pseudocercospora musae TaxID=113226 RepID=A0A139IQW8_9PEZI|nr:hypothetical protein AC579_4368 [Pseudocercospora musae]